MSKFGGLIINAFMKRIYLTLAVMISGFSMMAQQEYFIFIQETSGQPFYVRMGEQNHSSSAIGHLILSKLKDTTYNLFIVFPGGRGSEQMFTIIMNRKDHGYDLKNNNGKRELLDLQTNQLISPAISTQLSGQTVKRSDTYSKLMAGVVDDSAVLYSAAEDTAINVGDSAKNAAAIVAKIDSVKTADTVGTQAAVVTPPVITKKGKTKKGAAKNIPVKENPPVAADSVRADSSAVVINVPAAPDSTGTTSVRDKRDIIRLSTENVAEGRQMIFVDRTGAVNDTIRIIIPRRL
jgi:hypothetical protein